MKTKLRKRRRGVVLLVVLSLLTLFTLLMVTFIIVAGQYRQSALSAARVGRVDGAPRKLLDNATFALLRDSNDPKNVIRFHSLLFDMYGGDGFVGGVRGVGNAGAFAGASDGTGGNFFDLRMEVLPVPFVPANAREPVDLEGNYYPLSFVDGYYNGCVLTVVSSSVALGRSFRVVDYQAPPIASGPDPTQHVFRLLPIARSGEQSTVRPYTEDSNANGILDPGEDANNNGKLDSDRVIINGRPFNGTGFGYDSSAASADPKLNPAYALQPNQLLQTNATELANFVSGDADESYDAVDFQNMALAGIIPTVTTTAPDGVVVVPSFHRPELVNYWVANDPTQLERAIMRPMPWNHPDFDGSNPQLTLAKNPTAAQTTAFLSRLAGVDPLSPTTRINPWDVDNDGDRIADSIWVDLGFPAQTMPDGKQVRPLFAFLCTDLDGRINLNTAGSAGHLTGVLAKNATTNLLRNESSSSLPIGAGLGPAEINPGYSTTSSYPLFRNANSTDQYYTMLASRYGANQRPGANGMDTFASVKLFEFPTNYFTGTTGKAYNNPPDLFGELAFGLDYRGQPTYDTPDVTRTDLLSNSPYEFDVTDMQRGRADNPFTVAELERVLRFNDPSARLLPNRLTNLGGIAGNASRRRSVTTESFDVPVPPVLSPRELRSGFASTTNWQTQFPSYNSGRPLHVADLLAARLTVGGVAQADINSELAKMLSWDLRAGTRMDVNRPFGNGLDDNGNGVVDEHGPTSADQLEADPTSPEQIWAAGTYFDHDNDGNTSTTETNAYLARYHFAKHLYVLAMTLKEAGVDIGFDGNGPNAATETARGLAQWAVNVVDFRDADSIMTPFEYDPNPFNGWDVDGDITTDDATFGTDGLDNDGDGAIDEQDEQDRAARVTADRASLPNTIVWGCERPELLITETLAYHDRRTEDLADPEDTTTRTDTMGNVIGETDFEAGTGANDFDQRLRPRGYAYVELFNPWSAAEERKPAELYGTGPGPSTQGVALSRLAGTSPVWRLAVTDTGTDDLDDPTLSAPPAIERVVYFAAGGVTPGGAVSYTAPAGTGIARILPGRHAVVGTYHLTQDEVNPIDGNTDGVNEFVALIGRRNDPATINDFSQTRRIAMRAGSNPLENWFHVFDDGQTPTWMPPPSVTPTSAAYIANMQAPVTIPIFNFNISEVPAPATDPDGVAFGGVPPGSSVHPNTGELIYTKAFDVPFDDARFPTDTTRLDEKRVHLQRLANPLLAYHATNNPYRTVDRMNFDLTVFNGMAGSSGPDIPKNGPGTTFSSRERGNAASGPTRNLWLDDPTNGTTAPRGTGAGAIGTHYFTEDFVHSLGGLNSSFGTRYLKHFSDSTQTTAPSDELVGAPNSEAGVGPPFSWLTWNNRPFVSQHEMMLVPQSRSSRLLREYSMVNTTADMYDGSTGDRQCGHLLNFFATTHFDPSGGSSPPTPGANLYRLFDYTHVPSRFMGTETWLTPGTFASGTGTALLHPPFNRVPSFREPGKPNINTIFEPRVWDAIRGLNSTLMDHNTLVDSRRGYGTAGDAAISLNATVPTFFGNPFRASDAGDLVPVDSMKRAGVESTLLRSSTLSANGAGSTQSQNDGRFAVTSGLPHVEPDRNPYFRYQNMQRLSNLVTTRSNVYAIWVTMGLFEVSVEETSSGSGVYVERLGQEAGRQTGNVKRHRAFYIVDRSIPVAFQPGENHNVDAAILLRRFIE